MNSTDTKDFSTRPGSSLVKLATKKETEDKVRELQLQVIELQGNNDRRLNQLSDQLNGKLERSIRSFED